MVARPDTAHLGHATNILRLTLERQLHTVGRDDSDAVKVRAKAAIGKEEKRGGE